MGISLNSLTGYVPEKTTTNKSPSTGIWGGLTTVFKTIGQKSKKPGSLASGEMAKIIDLVSEGEIEGLVDGLASVYLDGVPVVDKQSIGSTYEIYNFDDVELETTLGTPNQGLLTNFPNIYSDVGVSTEITNVGGGGALLTPIMNATGTTINSLKIKSAGGGYTIIDQASLVTTLTGYCANATMTVVTGDASVIQLGHFLVGTNIPENKVFVKGIIDSTHFKLSKKFTAGSVGTPITITIKQGGAIISITDPTNPNNDTAHFVVTKVSTDSKTTGAIKTITKVSGGTFTAGVIPKIEVSGNPLTRTILDTNGVDAIKITVSTPALYWSNNDGGTDAREVSLLVEYKSREDDEFYKEAPIRREFTSAYTTNTKGSPIWSTSEPTDKYKIKIKWSYNHYTAKVGLEYYEYGDLQYRRAGSSDAWTTITSYKFSGKITTSQKTSSSGLYNYITTVRNPAVMVAEVLLNADNINTYEFQVIKPGVNNLVSGSFSILGISSVEIQTSDGIIKIEGKALNKYQKTVIFPVEGNGPYDIKVSRLTADSNNARLQNKTYWDSYSSIYYDKLSYPYSALMGIEFNAKQFARIPSRAYHIKGIKCAIPSNYNPDSRTYTGIWDGTFKTKVENINGINRTFIDKQYTNNPAWVLFDILTSNRYGLGDYMSVTNNAMYVSQRSNIDSISWVSGLVTVITKTAHNFVDGDYVLISKVSLNGYNGIFLINVLNTTTFQYVLNTDPGGSSTVGYVDYAYANTINVSGYPIDIYALYNIAQYCDELVDVGYIGEDGTFGKEPRFTCNMYLQTQEEAFTVINNIASIFRGMMYWSGGQLTSIQDSPAQSVGLFTNANVINGTFEYAGVGIKGRHTVAQVTWNDPKNLYKQNIEYVEYPSAVERFGYIPTSVVAMGCTSRGQAHRVGSWLLYTEQTESDTITFKTGLDGTLVYPGAIISVQDKHRAGVRLGGRIVTSTTNTIEVDSPVDIMSGKSYTLFYILPDGKVSSGYTISTSTLGPQTSLSISGTAIPENELPVIGAIWSISVSDLTLETWRVVSISESDEGATLTINAVKHNPEKYNLVESGVEEFDIPIQTYLSREKVELPSNLLVKDTLFEVAPKQFGNRLIISWDSDNTAHYYKVRYRINDDEKTSAWYEKTTSINSIEITENIEETVYDIELRAYNALGLASPSVTTTHTVIGKRANPEDIIDFSATTVDDKIKLSWSSVSDIDFDRYEIRFDTWYSTTAGSGYTAAPTVSFIGGGGTGAIAGASLSGDAISGISVSSGGTGYEVAPQVILSGGGGSGVIGIAEIDATTNTAGVITAGSVTAVKLLSTANLVYSGSELSTILPTSYSTVGTKTFYIKAVDTSGHYSSNTSTATITIAAPSAVTDIISSLSNDKVSITWTAPTVGPTQVSIKKYKIYINSILIAETTNTRYEYIWTNTGFTDNIDIVVEDIIGNTSTTASTSINIVNPNPITNLNTVISLDTLQVSWTHAVVSGNRLSTSKYNIYFGDVGNTIKIDEVVGNSYSLPWTFGTVNKVIGVQTVDIVQHTSTKVTSTASVVAPNAPTSLSGSLKETKLLFSWSPATSGANTLPIQYYELREGGTNWVSANFVAKIPASSEVLQYLYGIVNMLETSPTPPVGTLVYNQAKTFRIASQDSAGNYSATHSTYDVTITKPSAPTGFISAPADAFIQATWNAIIPGTGSDIFTLPIDRYEVKYDTINITTENAWSTATSAAALSGTTVQFDPPFNNTDSPSNNKVGTYYYAIRAYDIFDTTGAITNYSITITAPTAPQNLINKVIDNNVLLLWAEPITHTFPISRYMLKKSTDLAATYTTAQIIGEKDGGFTNVFEETSATYKYILAAIDTAGNIGVIASTNAEVKQPPDYVLTGDILRDNFDLTAYDSVSVATTSTNVAKSTQADTIGLNRWFGPIVPTETFQQHFTSTSASSTAYPFHTTAWTSPADQTAAGFPVYAQPAYTNGILSEVYDYGATINSNQYVSVSLNITNLAGTTGTYRVYIGTSVDGTAYTTVTSATQPVSATSLSFGTFAIGFRYVKLQIELISNTNGMDLIRIDNYRLKLAIKYTNDGGSGSVGTTGLWTIPLTSGGSGYTSVPSVSISGGGGAGAKAYATISGGVVTAITVSNSGTGYTAAPSVSIVGGGGSGAVANTASVTYTSASTGTRVAFNYDFIDINSIQTSYGGTSSGVAIYDFTDIPNPKYFTVLLFNSSGTAITGNFSWSAKGTT
jgi:predicted phage tail protein